MPLLIEYVPGRFLKRSEELIARCNAIIRTYQAQGFDLTLRQLYYQLVSRGVIPNKQNEYDKLGEMLTKARLAGRVPWDAIVDRTRFARINSHWDSEAEIMRGAAESYRLDRWTLAWDQGVVPEIWIEKDALVGVLDGVCTELDVPYTACRGYMSASELWAAAQRMIARDRAGQQTVVVHFGDHDPSGIDMTRDIQDRLATFCQKHGARVPEVRRVALTMDQVRQYDPPPNPAKDTDSRIGNYRDEYGDESWELDALEPSVIVDLVRESVAEVWNLDGYERAEEEAERRRELLARAADSWSDVIVPLLEA